MGFIICTERVSRYLEREHSGSLSYATVKEFLSDLKEKFGREDNRTMKVMELKKVEQGSKTMEKFVHVLKL